MNFDVLHEAKLGSGQTPEGLVLETAVEFLCSRNQPRWEQRYELIEVKERKGFLRTKKRGNCSVCETTNVVISYDLIVRYRELEKGSWVAKGKPRTFKTQDLKGFSVSAYCHDFFVVFCEGCKEARVVIHVDRAEWD